ncbi:type II toxin-antitoxin system RelE/ParE family toxin [Candidatus Micrarchaeota archaeon]|nr:type II toxin-antitoxin system RelE/ParE family toxin [Candidatus Micrarchaeota archaeon]
MVDKNKRLILWDNKAKESLRKALAYIRKESPQGAQIVKNKIFENVKRLPGNPEMFETDKLKRDNDGSYRVFFAYSYRVAYRITEDVILILRVRHTSQEPLEY